MGNTFFFQWEVDFMHWLQSGPAEALTTFSNAFGLVGDVVTTVAIIGFMYWCYDKKAAKYLIINLMPVLLIAPMIKNVFLRRRPYFDHEGIKCFKKVDASADLYDISAQGYSCPSMHSANSFTIFGSLAMFYKKKWLTVLSVILIFAVGFSRVTNGVHYPTDVLIGWALAAISLIVMPKLQKKTENTLIYAAAMAVIGLPGWFFCTSSDFYSSYGIAIGLLLGIAYQEKYVNFNNTRNVFKWILRLAGGIAVFLIISEGIKLILPSQMQTDGTFSERLIRFIRYTAGCFACMGLYPHIFDKIGRKRTQEVTK